MKDHHIHRGSSLVSFASLYGMSDYVAFALGNYKESIVIWSNHAFLFVANSGYKTYKYLPYGLIESLQPYWFRQAQENRSIFEKADKDRRLHFKALKDRILYLRV